jgi:hypothetical protein
MYKRKKDRVKANFLLETTEGSKWEDSGTMSLKSTEKQNYHPRILYQENNLQ